MSKMLFNAVLRLLGVDETSYTEILCPRRQDTIFYMSCVFRTVGTLVTVLIRETSIAAAATNNA